uniref:Uncharacterized protein n=1 Tax=Ditylenchus dipsaci TaxID=166011 RepID=A0A915E3S8_9BILA
MMHSVHSSYIFSDGNCWQEQSLRSRDGGEESKEKFRLTGQIPLNKRDIKANIWVKKVLGLGLELKLDWIEECHFWSEL